MQQNQNLVFSGYSMWSTSDSIGTGSAQRIFIDYPNDAADCNLTFDRIAGNFASTVSLRAEFQSGDFFEVNLQRFWDNPTEAFEIFPGSIVPAGDYAFNRVELNVSTSSGRPAGIDASISTGGFFDGHSTSLEADARLRIEPHVIVGLELVLSEVTRDRGSFSANSFRVRADVAVTPRWSHTLFVQFDNESSRIGVNYRMRYSPFPGSDLFIVWNNVWRTGLPGGVPFTRPTTGGLVVKYVYYHRV